MFFFCLLIFFLLSLLKINNMKRIHFKIDVPKDIQLINGLFHINGFEMFLVGGCVRDSFLQSKFPNLKIKDWDLVTNANPEEVERLLNFTDGDFSIHTIPIGEKFGVINAVTSNGGSFEIATFRSEYYEHSLENFLKFIEDKVPNEKIIEFKNKIMK